MANLGCAEYPPTSIRTCSERKASKAFSLTILETIPLDTPFSGEEMARRHAEPEPVRKALRQLLRMYQIHRLRGGMLVRRSIPQGTT